jgi:ABC-2 type transport system ATP-binding protein
MMALVEVRHLTKQYKNLTAVKDLNLTIEPGDCYGFIGPNGAGKTTTIKTMATLLEPTSGTVYIDGYDVTKHPLEVRKIIGYMPDFFGVYDDIKVWEYLDFFAASYKIPRHKRKQIIDDVLELTDLTVKRDAYVEELSRGMKQRLCLAKTLVHDPKLLLLDEPASGLDPRARIEIRALLKELQSMGKTIFVSSHILPELADLCNKVAILETGQLVVAGEVSDIMRQVHGALGVEVKFLSEEERDQAVKLLSMQPTVKNLTTENLTISFDYTGERENRRQLLQLLVTHGVVPDDFRERETNLEDVFMKVTKGIVS